MAKQPEETHCVESDPNGVLVGWFLRIRKRRGILCTANQRANGTKALLVDMLLHDSQAPVQIKEYALEHCRYPPSGKPAQHEFRFYK